MLRVRLGGQNWSNVERALPIAHSTIAEIVAERAEVSSTIAYRVALALDVPMQDVISGAAIPPGTCRKLRAVERGAREVILGQRRDFRGSDCAVAQPHVPPGSPSELREDRSYKSMIS